MRDDDLSASMRSTLLRARSYDGKRWIVYGKQQTLSALVRRGLLTQLSHELWVATLTTDGVMALSRQLQRVRSGIDSVS